MNHDRARLQENEFLVSNVPPGTIAAVGAAAVFNVGGVLCATAARCTHRHELLTEGMLKGATVTCPWHGSQFDVCTGAVQRGPAAEPLATYHVTVDGEIGRVDVPSMKALQGA